MVVDVNIEKVEVESESESEELEEKELFCRIQLIKFYCILYYDIKEKNNKKFTNIMYLYKFIVKIQCK